MRNGYTDSNSKDGGYSHHLGVSTTQRMKDHCKRENICCSRFIEECINEKLDRIEEESYRKLSREELISVIKELKAKCNGKG